MREEGIYKMLLRPNSQIWFLKGFIKQEDGETLDDQLEKLEVLKELLQPEKADDTVFDELIEKIKKNLKVAVENLHKDDDDKSL